MTTTLTPASRTRDVAVQLNTRVSLQTRDLIDEVAEREGISIRSVIESALIEKWGSGSHE